MADPNSGCWLWTEALFSENGYGAFYRKRREKIGAHRFAWILANGPIPDGMEVCHKCDVPSCVNPAHLFLGSAFDNAADKVAKDRQSKGSRHGMAILTELNIPDIRSDNRSLPEIARDYGVTLYAIWRVKHRKTWKHV